jgi:hypothetical protein
VRYKAAMPPSRDMLIGDADTLIDSTDMLIDDIYSVKSRSISPENNSFWDDSNSKFLYRIIEFQ